MLGQFYVLQISGFMLCLLSLIQFNIVINLLNIVINIVNSLIIKLSFMTIAVSWVLKVFSIQKVYQYCLLYINL